LFASNRYAERDAASTRPIPFLDLVTQHEALEPELVSVFRRALSTAGFVGGSMVDEFEREFAAFCDVRHAVGVASGTDALRFALIAAGVRPGDTVVTVPNTFIATAEAISQAAARPDFVDVDECTYTMSPAALGRYFSEHCVRNAEGVAVHRRTGSPVTAVVPVHLYGQMADMERILELAAQYKLRVIEDACQAHGAQYFSGREQRLRQAGSIGCAAAFSFYPGKNLGACGEAGAVTTNDEHLARTCRLLREHGQSAKYCHDIEGYNGRLDAIQAGLLRVKLRHLPEWNEQRRARARTYDRLLGCAESVALPVVPRWSRPVYHLYVVRVAERARVQQELAAAGIGTGIHYPTPLHLTRAYEWLQFRSGDFPVAERLASQILSLPMYPELAEDSQRRVAETLLNAVADAK
jgi:dTDP-4-amino-4,6-dideoxygalactose transaminase